MLGGNLHLDQRLRTYKNEALINIVDAFRCLLSINKPCEGRTSLYNQHCWLENYS